MHATNHYLGRFLSINTSTRVTVHVYLEVIYTYFSGAYSQMSTHSIANLMQIQMKYLQNIWFWHGWVEKKGTAVQAKGEWPAIMPDTIQSCNFRGIIP